MTESSPFSSSSPSTFYSLSSSSLFRLLFSLSFQSLYRAAMRSVPSVVAGYELECTPGHLRAVIRALFRQQMHLTDPGMIDVLCYKGELELEETLQMWKTKVSTFCHWQLQKGCRAIGLAC